MPRDLIHKGGSAVGRGDWFGRSLMTLRDDMDRLFSEIWGADEKSRGLSFPAIDVSEKKDKFRIKAELHGMNPDDVELSVDEGYLTIQGERREEHEEKDKNETYLHREISYGSFRRVIPLPESAEIDKAEASFEKGVLTVEVPKREDAIGQARKLRINNRDSDEERAGENRRN